MFELYFELYSMGGPLFMGVLTLTFIIMIVVAVINGIPIFRGVVDLETTARRIGYVKSVGLFALVIGILGQLIGLFMAFRAIEAAGDISPSLLAQGFKVSLITTLYGFFIYIFSFLIWFGLSFVLRKKSTDRLLFGPLKDRQLGLQTGCSLIYKNLDSLHD